MAVKDLDSTQILALVIDGLQRHALTGARFAQQEQPYYDWMMQTVWRLSQASFGHLQVRPSSTLATKVDIAPGRCQINGVALAYAGGEVDLAAYNNATAYIWIYNNSGAATIGAAAHTTGWPATAHVKLAEVPVTAGTITEDTFVDRRPEAALKTILMAALSNLTTLTDNSGGASGGSTVAAVTDAASAANAIATLTAKVNALVTDTNNLKQRLRDAGALAS